MKKRTLKRLAAAFLTGAMMVATLGMSVCAESATVTFDKTLDMSGAEGTTVPSLTFKYTVKPGNAHVATYNSDGTLKTPEITAGVGKPTISDVTFSSSDTLAENKIKKSVTVNFDDITFPEPGIYRYVITETNESSTTYPYITYDTNNERYMDVYVVYEEDTTNTVISGSTIYYAAEEKTDVNGGEFETDAKEGFVNKYDTKNLSISKTVTGNMGNKTQDFTFSISFTEGPVSATIDAVKGETTTKVEFNESRTATATFTLKHNESIIFKGLPSTTKYTIVESLATDEGYITSATISEGSSNANTLVVTRADDNSETDEKDESDDQTIIKEKVMGTESHSVVVKNHKEVTTPTGIITTFAPYVLMVAFAAVVAFFFLRRRQREI